ncbi:hypothetical protein MtrunA17_Chr3g0096281 [Medicago truncatula]|uniref:Uncharacterized protein n=1 Tax=Medicago truncatula TaxID=3880 RepID=A0A396IR57_MEDTR|nr:hypothetical protein MtrunA17_Chr3g0096281 [Medicago truncatula]
MGGTPLKVKGKRTKLTEKEDAPAPKPKRTKVSKTEASKASDSASASEEVIQKKRTEKPKVRDAAREAALREEVIQKKRTKGMRDIEEAVREVAVEMVNDEEEEPKKKKAKKPLEIVSPTVVVTPAMTRMAKEYAANAIAEKKQLAEQYRKEIDERLKTTGFVETNSLSAEKATEVLGLSAEIEKWRLRKQLVCYKEL